MTLRPGRAIVCWGVQDATILAGSRRSGICARCRDRSSRPSSRWRRQVQRSRKSQQPTEKVGRGIILGSRGGPVGEAQSGTVLQDKATGLEFSARAGFATDYIYRGVTLSDRQFALGAGFEAAFDKLYAGITVASVKLPTAAFVGSLVCRRHPAEDRQCRSRSRLDLLRLSEGIGARPDRRHRLLGSEPARRDQAHRGVADRRRLRLFAECVEYRRYRKICRGGARARSAGRHAAEGYQRLALRQRRLFALRQHGRNSRRLSAAGLCQLECRRRPSPTSF